MAMPLDLSNRAIDAFTHFYRLRWWQWVRLVGLMPTMWQHLCIVFWLHCCCFWEVSGCTQLA